MISHVLLSSLRPCSCARVPEKQQLPPALHGKPLPNHVAITVDGNSRWAKRKGLPTSAGHQAGFRALKEIVDLSCQWGIAEFTAFAFSTENWLRPKIEVEKLMIVLEGFLRENLRDFSRDGIRVSIIGDLSKVPKSLQEMAKEAEEITRNESQMDFKMAINYGGRWDIVQACQKIAHKARHGLLEPAEVTESLFAQELATNRTDKFSYPDLLIRPGGELRLSNFLLWQLAYTELYFAPVHAPDFKQAEYVEALSSFQRRERRFGRRNA